MRSAAAEFQNVRRKQQTGRWRTNKNVSFNYILLLFLSLFGPFSSISSSSPAIFKESPQDSHFINFKTLFLMIQSFSISLYSLFIFFCSSVLLWLCVAAARVWFAEAGHDVGLRYTFSQWYAWNCCDVCLGVFCRTIYYELRACNEGATKQLGFFIPPFHKHLFQRILKTP